MKGLGRERGRDRMFSVRVASTAPRDYTNHHIRICGETFVADYSGALYWPAHDALIVADLHLEKGSTRAHRGRLLPPYDTIATLRKLGAVIARYDPALVIALGDSLHDTRAASRMAPSDLALLHTLQQRRDWLWLAGNHDPLIDASLGGRSTLELTLSGLTFRHEPRDTGGATHEIAAHLHPAARLAMRGQTLRRPCFIGNGDRLVLPAFGAYTGGLNVLDEAFGPLFGPDSSAARFSVLMLGDAGLYPVSIGRLRGD